MKKTQILLILFAFMMIKCEKQKIDNQQDFLVINDKNNYSVERYDTILQGEYNTIVPLNIDLDNDGIQDFQIYAEVWGSPGLGLHPEIKLLCLQPNAYLSATEYTDSIFQYMTYDTSYYDKNVYIQINSIFECRKTNPSEMFNGMQKEFIANYFNKRDTIMDTSWQNDTIKLSSLFDSFATLADEIRGDTVINKSTYYYYDCHTIPYNSSIYLAVKTVQEKYTYLGWIKINIIDSSTISVFETAVIKVKN